MDPLTTVVVGILTKFATDGGVDILKKAGQAAADAAGKVFNGVMHKLKGDPRFGWIAEQFAKDPETYKTPVADAVEEEVKADPKFAAELKALVEAFDKAQKAAGVSIVNTGSGDVFAGDNAFKVDTNYGNITYGGTHTTNRSGGTDINAQSGDINISGDVVGGTKTDK